MGALTDVTLSDEFAPDAVIHDLPFGVVVVDPDGAVVGTNETARELLAMVDRAGEGHCSELLACARPGGPCEHGCLAARAARSGGPLPEIRIDTGHGEGAEALWVTASPLRRRAGAILHLRPGQAGDRRRRSEPHWLEGPELRIEAFGRTCVECNESPLGGDWLQHRPGQLLKYLVCERRRVVHAEEIADALWPGAGRQGLSSVRHFVHRLRGKLEPHREGHGHSSFVVATGGGYTLDHRRVSTDVDEFEKALSGGLAAMERLETGRARELLERAVELYRGEFLEDEPYAEWAYAERDRLRMRAARALRALIVMEKEKGNGTAGALEHLRRLADLEAFDSAIHRELLTALLAEGRRSEASRRYKLFRRRLRHEFGQEPDFDLAALAPPGG